MLMAKLFWLFGALQVFVYCKSEPENIEETCPQIAWLSDQKSLQYMGGSIVSHMNFGHANYTHNISCNWKIPDQPGYEIHLEFIDFAIEGPSRWVKKCSYDNLTLTWINLNGILTNLTVCGRKAPDKIIASRNVSVSFNSDSSVSTLGFKISFSYISINKTGDTNSTYICSSLIKLPDSLILQNEKSTPDNQTCVWNIPAPLHGLALLVVWDSMRLSSPKNDGKCDSNYVMISYTKRSLERKRRKKLFCGQEHLPSALLTYDSVSITFKSKTSEQNNDFRLLFIYADAKFLNVSNNSLKTVPFTSVLTSTTKSSTQTSNTVKWKTQTTASIPCPPILWKDKSESSGLIQSHTGSGNYSPKSNCSWKIPKPKDGYYTKLQIKHFDMEDFSPLTRFCDYDYLLIMVESNIYEPRRYCGNNPPPAESIYSNDIASIQGISIHFYSDSSINGGGFQIIFEYVRAGTKCGNITSFSGGGFIDSHIRTPLATKYESNITCIWKIPPPSSVGKQFVLVSFSNFLIESHSLGSCRYDNITFRYTSINNRQGPSNATFCGKIAPPPFLSTSGVAVVFRTDATLNFDGFRLNFNYTDDPNVPPPPSPCLKIFWENQPDPQLPLHIQRQYPNIRRGVLLSHVLSSTYRSHLICNWSIPAQAGFRAAIYFYTFHLEKPNSEGRCSYDNLTITYDQYQPNYYPFIYGPSRRRQSALIPSSQSQVLCGLQFQKPPIVSENGIDILFQTDHSNEREGFNATIYYIPINDTFQEGEPNEEDGSTIPSISSKTCTDVLEVRNGTRNTLDFWTNPNHYAANLNCVWILKVPRYRRRVTMQVFIEAIDIPCFDTGGLPSDKLIIKSSFSSNIFGYGTKKFCGSNNDTKNVLREFLINAPAVLVNFQSNRNGAGRGFRIIYQEWKNFSITQNLCLGVEPVAGGGIIRSNTRSSYSANMICSWKIPAQPNYAISLRFISLDLESGNNCTFDNVTVSYLDSNEQTQASLIFCGQTIPQPMKSQNGFKIQFKTDKSIHKTGFVLQYNYIRNGNEDHCSNYNQSLTHLNNTVGIIESVWNESYTINLSCEWLIGVSGHLLNITFDSIDIEESSLIGYSYNKCKFDNLTITHLDSLFNVVKYTICGRKVPDSLVIPAPAYIRFQTSKAVERTGFRLRYTKLNMDQDPCLDLITFDDGGIIRTNKEMERYYSANVICSWSIPARPNNMIILSFNSFDLESANNCTLESVTVSYLDNNKQTQASRMFCGQAVPEPTMSQNGFKIQFKREKSIRRSFFNLRYKYMLIDYEDRCPKNRSNTFGSIESVWNENYTVIFACEWLIGVSGHLLNITFDSIDIEESALNDNKCQFNNVTITHFDGLFNVVKYTICGRKVPDPLVIPAPAYIRFQTSKPVKSTGFRIRYSELNASPGSLNYVNNVTLKSNKGVLVFQVLFIVFLVLVILFLVYQQHGYKIKAYFSRVKERSTSGIQFENLSYERMNNQAN